MTLAPEKLSELKQIIHTHLSQMDVQTHIKDAINESSQRRDKHRVDEEDLVAILREKGVIEDVMQKLKFDNVCGAGSSGQGVMGIPTPYVINRNDTSAVKQPHAIRANVDPSRHYLFIQALGGRAFLEHLQDAEPLPGQVRSYFTLHVHFRGHRFKSRPTPCACEPDLQEAFLLDLDQEGPAGTVHVTNTSVMLGLSDPVHLVLIKTAPTGETTLVSTQHLEWRSVLAAPSSRCTRTIEFMGIGPENNVPVGVIEFRLELLPHATQTITDDTVAAQLALQKNRCAERERLFLIYAKQWWKEYLQIRPTHKERLVKIFAQDENCTNRPVPSFVRPLRAGRLLDTPRQAARFVSLIGYEKVTTLGGGERGEQWTSMHAFICRNKGDVEDHAVLLCSLLLGFGLQTYVCVGTKQSGSPHAWCMTVNTDGEVVFWESLTGHRYMHRRVNPEDPPGVPQPKVAYPYRTVGCVFNHEFFYANSQPTDLVQCCEFTLTDECKWKAMASDAVQSVCADMPAYPGFPPLCAPTLDAAMASNDLEQELRILVTQHRLDRGLTTSWDDHLSYLLTPALAAYETERLTGVTAGNEEFQQAIRRAVPDGHTFKGFPTQFVHRNGRRLFAVCQKSPVCDEIINCRGDHVRLALRVRIFAYPESACATWIMFACKYKSVL